MRTPATPEMLSAVALDLALGDDPRLADERRPQDAVLHLIAKGGRRKAETVARLGQCQELHFGAFAPFSASHRSHVASFASIRRRFAGDVSRAMSSRNPEATRWLMRYCDCAAFIRSSYALDTSGYPLDVKREVA